MLLFSFLSFALIGIGHIYLYLLLLGQPKIKFRSLAFISILFIILLVLIVNVFRLPELNIVVLFLFLFILGLLFKKATWYNCILFTTLSVTIFTVAKNGVIGIVTQVYYSSAANVYIWTSLVLQCCSIFFIVLVLFFSRHFIVLIGRYILHSKWYVPTYIVSIVSLLCFFVINVPSTPFLAQLHTEYSFLLHNILLLLNIALVLMLVVNTVLSKERMLEKEEQYEQQQLLEYVRKLEYTHDELVTFRHDYLNLLLSLEHGIRAGDVEQIKRTYDEVLAPTGYALAQLHVELAKLSQIEISELKSLLSAKLMFAERQQIEVQLDIPYPILKLPIALPSYLRIISIFIDNALESSTGTELKTIQLAIFEVENTHYCIVKNRISEPAIALQPLYEKRYTTKGEHRGIGLYSVQRIINKLPQATLMTQAEDYYFTQNLSIKLNSTAYDEKTTT